ncbi:tRNA lysidine(34) synthetase TilS [Bifidobacterium moukalabense]|uniref:tRNA(Ile)-lysidine synthase n=1 Tax=Bifidobacterium moukalabense DSM 27321 TaxID=1435051 RepID=W4N7E3_9BIFI|nr:tRNA lysidine(34) synthetase TilS [Bifidobacterium moukalabense]ETY70954.1 lysidine synthetase [Bifidobacterium moukalabense DSM 27321]
MVYSSRLRKAIGQLRTALADAGFGLQDARFTRHGKHEPSTDAPLIMVACSGGRDSMALAAVSATVCASLGLRCGAVIIDHRLQSGSADVAEMTARRCRALGLDPVRVRAIEVHGTGQGVEAAAREARYSAIVEECSDAAAVLLAHTRNDQAETVLIGLLRSAGLDAIAGMEGSFSRDGVTFLRPWLDVTREETTGICGDLELTWWDDPTNGPDTVQGDGLPPSDPLPADYPLRSRVRHDLMPYLRRFAGADVVSRLSIGAGLAQTDREYLNERAQEIMERAVTFDGDQVRFDVVTLRTQHEAIRLRVIAHALGQAGIACSARQVRQIDRLITDWHGQRGVTLPSGYSANRQKHVIRVCQDGGHANR